MRSMLRILMLATVLPWLGLAGCAQWAAAPSLHWEEAELQQWLERRFPLDRRLLEVLDVKVSQPRVRLVPQRDRVGTEVQVEALDRLFGRAFRGRLAFESGLRYDPTDQSLRLTQVQVTAFELDSAGAPTRPSLQRLGAALTETLLDDAVIHRLSADQKGRLAALGVRPGDIKVTARGLEMNLVPVP